MPGVFTEIAVIYFSICYSNFS